MNSIQTIVSGPPMYIYSRDCGYCHGHKEIIGDGYSIPSLKSIHNDEDDSRLKGYPNSITIGVSFELLDIQEYETMMDRGFRRSSSFIYKTDLLRSCCRMFTIRTNLQMFKPVKEHRHTINRFLRRIGIDESSVVKKNFADYNVMEKIISGETQCNESKFKTVLEPPHFTKEKFALYKKYQNEVHGDKLEEIKESGFDNFLCSSPFREDLISHDSHYWEKINQWRKFDLPEEIKKDEFLGPAHECYYIDGKLVAIAVLDILPNSISSVYFIWDPEYRSLGLGTLSGIRELILTHKLGKEFYYLGLFIGDCNKMKYKGKFGGEIIDQTSRKIIKLSDINDVMTRGELISFINNSNKENSNGGEPRYSETLEKVENIEEYSNRADSIYGFYKDKECTSYKVAQKSVLELITKNPSLSMINEFELSNGEDKVWDNHMKKTQISKSLPLIIPGLIPIWQMNVDQSLLEHTRCLLFDFETRSMDLFQWDSSHDSYKRYIFDIVRLFGEQFLDVNVLLAS